MAEMIPSDRRATMAAWITALVPTVAALVPTTAVWAGWGTLSWVDGWTGSRVVSVVVLFGVIGAGVMALARVLFPVRPDERPWIAARDWAGSVLACSPAGVLALLVTDMPARLALGAVISFIAAAWLVGPAARRPRRLIHPAVPAWTPPPGATGHSGEPLSPGRAFFAPPPEDIGPVVSAHGTLEVGEGPLRTGPHLVAAIAGGALALAVWTAIGRLAPSVFLLPSELMEVVGPLTVFGAWLSLRIDAECGYVGRDGCARYRLDGEGMERVDTFRYAEADTLWSWRAATFRNTVYVGSELDDRYENRGEVAFRLRMNYDARVQAHRRDYADAVADAWSRHRLPALAAELGCSGSLSFATGTKGNRLVLENGRLWWRPRKGTTVSAQTSEVSVGIRNGVLTLGFPRRDRPGREVKVRLRMAGVANVRILLSFLRSGA